MYREEMMRVKMRFVLNGVFNGETQTLEHITEIHYGYKMGKMNTTRIALESDIDGTGYTYNIVDIAEMEIEEDLPSDHLS